MRRNGHQTCHAIAGPATLDISGIEVKGDLDENSIKLPIFSYAFDEACLSVSKEIGDILQTDDLAHILATGPAQPESAPITPGKPARNAITNFSMHGIPPSLKGAGSLVNRLDLQTKARSNNSNDILIYSEFSSTGQGSDISSLSSKPFIRTGGADYPVLIDNGLSLWNSYGTSSFYGSIWRVLGEDGIRRVPSISDLIRSAVLSLPAVAKSVSIECNEVAYVKSGTAFRGKLIPTRKVSFIVRGERGLKQAMVIMGWSIPMNGKWHIEKSTILHYLVAIDPRRMDEFRDRLAFYFDGIVSSATSSQDVQSDILIMSEICVARVSDQAVSVDRKQA